MNQVAKTPKFKIGDMVRVCKEPRYWCSGDEDLLCPLNIWLDYPIEGRLVIHKTRRPYGSDYYGIEVGGKIYGFDIAETILEVSKETKIQRILDKIDGKLHKS